MTPEQRWNYKMLAIMETIATIAIASLMCYAFFVG